MRPIDADRLIKTLTGKVRMDQWKIVKYFIENAPELDLTHDNARLTHACVDLISREDAIEAVAHEYGAKHIRSVGETVADILQAIKALPSAEVSKSTMDFISRANAIEELCTMMVGCFNADEEVIDAIKTTMNEISSVETSQNLAKHNKGFTPISRRSKPRSVRRV